MIACDLRRIMDYLYETVHTQKADIPVALDVHNLWLRLAPFRNLDSICPAPAARSGQGELVSLSTL